MAAKRQIHLGAVPYGTGGPGSHTLWLDPEIPGDASVDVDWNIWTAQLAERGKFDLGFIVDSQFIGGTVPGRGLYVVDAQHDDPAAYADWLAVTRPIVDRYLRGRAA